MKKLAVVFAFLFLFSSANAFSIVSYENNAEVLADGSLNVYEKMVFNLDEVYNEGYRSIRPQDFDSLSSITVHSVKLNGENVPYETVMNGVYAEIVWKKTVLGTNTVELNYTIDNRVELFDDFARICHEHYGANWAVPAQTFSSRMTLPEETRGKVMHFEIYSSKKGDAYVDDLSIVTEISNVPSGNYIGGCYLFYRGAVNTTRIVSGSAYEILDDERESYGSESVLEPEDPTFCLSIFIIPFILIGALALKTYNDNRSRKLPPENILPPEKEEPCVVSVLMRGELSQKDIMSAAILKLISMNVIDIVELEKKGGKTFNREKTILILKKKNAKLKTYERALVNMLFEKGNTVDLDKMAEDFEKVKTRSQAKKLNAVKQLNKYDDAIEKILKQKKVLELRSKKSEKMGILVAVLMFVIFLSCPFGAFISDSLFIYLESGRFLELLVFIIAPAGIAISIIYLALNYLKVKPPEGMKTKFNKWTGFIRAVTASRLKTYPPASAVVWDDILVYATALGLAQQVEKHLSELKVFDIRKLEKVERVRTSVVTYYAAAYAVNNLSKYGNRSGRSSGGFSSGSSGGWSGGGGGFSGGSSGGGGFR